VDGGVTPAKLAPTPPRLLGLRDANLEDAVHVGRRNLRLVDPVRQPDGARKAAVAPLEPVVAVALLLGLLHALTGDGERVVLDLDLDLVLIDAGQIECVDELGLRLPDVEGWNPRLTRTAAALSLEQTVEQATHLTLELGQLAKRFPTDECCHHQTSCVISYGYADKENIKYESNHVKSPPQ
jgi:hypothetical protein